jgi:endo-1,4-beta-xylanase
MRAIPAMPFIFAAGLLAAFIAMNTIPAHAGPPAPTTLRQVAEKHDLLIGAAVRPDLFNKPGYTETLSSQFNLVTAENAMKFENTEPAEGKFDFREADQIVDFALKHKMKVRGHTLVWHQQVADWVTEERCKDAESILKRHIAGVAGHFKGKLIAWDVVNEALDDDGKMRDTFWLRCIGPDYIEKAFRWASTADPNAKLFYNDYNIESPGDKAEAAFTLVSNLKKKGVPIDGIGLQMHLDRVPSDVFLAKYMQRFAAIGIDVHITEMDVRLPMPQQARDLSMQADAYRMALRRCVEAPNCKAFVTWGVGDRYSWIPQFFKGFGSALLFDDDFKPKPAFRAALAELSK